ncbi:hypothetical protein Hanom_Chr06g00562731 [Helianthus anomalus]
MFAYRFVLFFKRSIGLDLYITQQFPPKLLYVFYDLQPSRFPKLYKQKRQTCFPSHTQVDNKKHNRKTIIKP